MPSTPSLRLDIHSNSLQFLLASLFLLLCVIDPVVSPTLSLFPFLCPSPLSLHTIFPIIMFSMYAFLSAAHSHIRMLPSGFFASCREGGRELFVGENYGDIPSAFPQLQLARRRQQWEKLDVTTVEVNPLFPSIGASEKEKGEIESIEHRKKFSTSGFWQ
jgi:hypothetical protein